MMSSPSVATRLPAAAQKLSSGPRVESKLSSQSKPVPLFHSAPVVVSLISR
jgi:hypothetical protein